ncbi:hypothetical protein EPYR_01738 [Erwinia pyrifoliae DSM 12163]|nr:hypothetical protein EPYR_01738 [Erwinia pyrifoliae DSM 12163]
MRLTCHQGMLQIRVGIKPAVFIKQAGEQHVSAP